MRLFEDMEVATEQQILRPKGYTGLHAFHKYWGKKPLEVLGFLIEKLTLPGDLVIDPFMGSGTAGIEALRLNRRFIGCDLNPVATKLTELQLNPPTFNSVVAAFDKLEKTARPLIAESYRSPHFVTPATHYLWDGANLSEVWDVKKGKRGRKICPPAPGDFEMVGKFEECKPRNFRPPQFFSNARINARSDMLISELFTGRAVRNIDILLDAIRELPAIERETLSLALTAAAGQMSKMVFAITGRGKTTGPRVEKIEVGSWVIGFWRPHLHFEINVWSCFENKVNRLIAALQESDPTRKRVGSSSVDDVLTRLATHSTQQADAVDLMDRLPQNCADLIVTDPPHGDRQPYLELSELWNALLNLPVDFPKEIVVSNAGERKKTFEEYTIKMRKFFQSTVTKVKPTGALALLFNASDSSSWEFLSEFRSIAGRGGMEYLGCFPAKYSALSVVQDNRNGSLKHDYVLLFSPSPEHYRMRCDGFPGWSMEMPVPNCK